MYISFLTEAFFRFSRNLHPRFCPPTRYWDSFTCSCFHLSGRKPVPSGKMRSYWPFHLHSPSFSIQVRNQVNPFIISSRPRVRIKIVKQKRHWFLGCRLQHFLLDFVFVDLDPDLFLFVGVSKKMDARSWWPIFQEIFLGLVYTDLGQLLILLANFKHEPARYIGASTDSSSWRWISQFCLRIQPLLGHSIPKITRWAFVQLIYFSSVIRPVQMVSVSYLRIIRLPRIVILLVQEPDSINGVSVSQVSRNRLVALIRLNWRDICVFVNALIFQFVLIYKTFLSLLARRLDLVLRNVNFALFVKVILGLMILLDRAGFIDELHRRIVGASLFELLLYTFSDILVSLSWLRTLYSSVVDNFWRAMV